MTVGFRLMTAPLALVTVTTPVAEIRSLVPATVPRSKVRLFGLAAVPLKVRVLPRLSVPALPSLASLMAPPTAEAVPTDAVTVPFTVPVPPRAPPAATVTALPAAVEPVTRSVPPLIVVAPV